MAHNGGGYDRETIESRKGEPLDHMLLHINIGEKLLRGSTDKVVSAKHFAAHDWDYKVEVTLSGETLTSQQPISHDQMLWAAQKDDTFDFNGTKRTVKAKVIYESGGQYFCELQI